MLTTSYLHLPHWAWYTLSTAVALVVLRSQACRRWLWQATKLLAVVAATPLRGRCSPRFARWQREKLLAKDTNDAGETSRHDYCRLRQNYILARGTYDLWLPTTGTVTPTMVANLREDLSYHLTGDETWAQDVRPLGRRRVRIYGKSYYPQLSKSRISHQRLVKALKKFDQGWLVGTAAGEKNLCVSLRDKILCVVGGRPGSGKSLQGQLAVESLLVQNIVPVVYDHSTVDFGSYASRCHVITTLEDLLAAVIDLEETARDRLKAMRQASQRLGLVRISDSKTFEALVEPMPLRCLIIDEHQEVTAKKLSGTSQEVALKKEIQERLINIIAKYRKCNITIILLGVPTNSGDLAVPLTAASYKSSGYLPHVETSRSFLDGSDLANNQALTAGRMVSVCSDWLTPKTIQVPLGIKPPKTTKVSKPKTKHQTGH